jgi:hypothetical protein
LLPVNRSVRTEDPGVCGELRILTSAVKDGADPKNIDPVTGNAKCGKFKMCQSCQIRVPDFGGEFPTG